MATAIFITGLCIGGAINPEWVRPDQQGGSWAAICIVMFFAYDVASLVVRARSQVSLGTYRQLPKAWNRSVRTIYRRKLK